MFRSCVCFVHISELTMKLPMILTFDLFITFMLNGNTEFVTKSISLSKRRTFIFTNDLITSSVSYVSILILLHHLSNLNQCYCLFVFLFLMVSFNEP